MGARENLQRLLDKKQQEIVMLEAQLDRAKIYIQALQDSMKVLPREAAVDQPAKQTIMRPGTTLAKVRAAILAAGKPLHINDIVVALGKTADKGAKVSVSSSIAWYVRRGQIFTRPLPNTFGLVELSDSEQTPVLGSEGVELPATFGG